MKIILGACLSSKNYKFLFKFLDSLKNLIFIREFNVDFIFVIEEKNFFFKDMILKKFNNKKFKILLIKKNGIPYSRNEFLNYIRIKKPNFSGFFDDDCLIPRNWLKNMLSFIKYNRCHLVGGPQLHKTKDKFYDNLYKLIEPQKKHKENIEWAATNNVFFNTNILLKNDHIFDEKLKTLGGSDQLFFKRLKKNFGLVFKWNVNSPVYENIQAERENLRWFINRNLRYGYSGSYIDKSIYGNYLGTVINIFKFLFLVFSSFIIIFFFIDKKFLFKSFFYLCRASGRFIGLTNYKPKKYI